MSYPPGQEFILIPVEWCVVGLWVVAGAGTALGFVSAIWPGRSIRFYQFLMKCFSWKAEPLHPEREVRNTRWLGIVMLVTSAFIFVMMRTWD